VAGLLIDAMPPRLVACGGRTRKRYEAPYVAVPPMMETYEETNDDEAL